MLMGIEFLKRVDIADQLRFRSPNLDIRVCVLSRNRHHFAHVLQITMYDIFEDIITRSIFVHGESLVIRLS